jgi:hypothetical protein
MASTRCFALAASHGILNAEVQQWIFGVHHARSELLIGAFRSDLGDFPGPFQCHQSSQTSVSS